MKLLIVNGDDFGASRETNAGIVRCYREGILTSASLMVAEPARDEAAALARECPELDVGLHLVFCRGKSVLSPAELGTLVDSRAAFTDSPVKAGLRYFFNRSLRQKIVDELAAQGILIRSPSTRGVAEEAPGAYKDVGAVVAAAERAGLARRVARLRPLICVKG